MNLVAEEARLKNISQNASSNKETLQRRLRRIDEEVALAAKKVNSVEKDKQAVATQLDEIRQKIESYAKVIEELKATLTGKSAELGNQVKQAHTLELERNQIRSQLSTLKKMAENPMKLPARPAEPVKTK